MLQFHFRQKTYLFSFRMSFFIFCLSFFTLFCALGTWQLHRFEYKKTLLTTYQQRLVSTPKTFLSLANQPPQSLQFQRIMAQGEFVNDLTMFVQNQVYKNQMGVEVLTPVRLPHSKNLLLIDRGWVPAGIGQTPPIETVQGPQQITGYIKLLNEYQFILGKNIFDTRQRPIVMQKIDMTELSQLTHQSFYPFILRMDAKEAHGFVRDWAVITLLPQRHLGYAVQWFLLALVTLISFIIFCCERTRESHDSA
jgi:surfeit locus 1 family protein